VFAQSLYSLNSHASAVLVHAIGYAVVIMVRTNFSAPPHRRGLTDLYHSQ